VLAIVAYLGILVVSSCRQPEPVEAGTAPVVDASGPLALVDGTNGDAARSEGVIRFIGGCVLLENRGETVLLVWPAAQTKWDDTPGSIVFTSIGGEVVELSNGVGVALGGSGISRAENGISVERWIASLDWVAPPNPSCIRNGTWFVGDVQVALP